MSGRSPNEIWQEGIDEGERRLARTPLALAATGFAGAVEIMFGIVAVVVVSGALTPLVGKPAAHVIGSLFFGIAFVLITVGRAELFTENFLIPVGAVHARRATFASLLRMWAITLGANIVGLLAFAAIFSVRGVLTRSTLTSAGALADAYGHRGLLAAFLSAVVAGALMTLFTWVSAAAEGGSSRVVVALVVGFVLAAPSLNHAVVSFGELVFGILAGTATSDVGDLLRNLGIAVAGNLIGGVGLVFATRLAQVRGEPSHDRGERAADVITVR